MQSMQISSVGMHLSDGEGFESRSLSWRAMTSEAGSYIQQLGVRPLWLEQVATSPPAVLGCWLDHVPAALGLAWPAARCPAPQDRSDLLVGPARSADLLITTPSLFITLRVVFIAILIIIIAHLAWRRIRVPGRCTLVRTCPDRVGSLFSKEKRDGSRRNYTYCITLVLAGQKMTRPGVCASASFPRPADILLGNN